MAMFAPIPLPGIDNPQFKDVMDYFEQLQRRKAQQEQFAKQFELQKSSEERAKQLQPILMEEHKAKTEQARSKTKQFEILQNWFNQLNQGGAGNVGAQVPGASNQGVIPQIPQTSQDMAAIEGGETSQIPQTEQPKVTSYDPMKAYQRDAIMAKMMGLPDIKIVDVDGVQTAISPFSGAIPLVKGKSDWQKKVSAADAKIIENWNETLTGASEMQPTLDNIQETITKPVFETMKQHPEYFGHDMAWFERFGTPEQQDLIGNLATATGQLYVDMGQKFKGQFRVGEQALVKDLKPNKNDTLGVLIGKTRAMQAMNQILTQRLSLANKLVRTGNYSPSEALDKADKMVNAKAIRDRIEHGIKSQIKANERVKSASEKITIIDSTGNQHTILKINLDKARERDPNLKVLEEKVSAEK